MANTPSALIPCTLIILACVSIGWVCCPPRTEEVIPKAGELEDLRERREAQAIEEEYQSHRKAMGEQLRQAYSAQMFFQYEGSARKLEAELLHLGYHVTVSAPNESTTVWTVSAGVMK